MFRASGTTIDIRAWVELSAVRTLGPSFESNQSALDASTKSDTHLGASMSPTGGLAWIIVSFSSVIFDYFKNQTGYGAMHVVGDDGELMRWILS